MMMSLSEDAPGTFYVCNLFFLIRPLFRIDEGSSRSLPVSAPSSAAPSTRKRRLSESDASGPSKRPRRNVSNPIPATISLSGTPEFLADWFSNDHTGDDTDLFNPESLLDITVFDPADYFPENDEAPDATQSITQSKQKCGCSGICFP